MTTTPQTKFDFRTEAEPLFYFTVDGALYEMKRLSQLNKDQEVELQILIKQEAFYKKAFDNTNPSDDKKLRETYSRFWDTRIRLISLMTTVPPDVAGKILLGDQTKLIQSMTEQANMTAATNMFIREQDGTLRRATIEEAAEMTAALQADGLLDEPSGDDD